MAEFDSGVDQYICPNCGGYLEGQYMSIRHEGTGEYDGYLCEDCGSYFDYWEIED